MPVEDILTAAGDFFSSPAGGVVEDAAIGAGTGALTGAITGGNIGTDALIGGAGGGLVGGFNAATAPAAPSMTAVDTIPSPTGMAGGGQTAGAMSMLPGDITTPISSDLTGDAQAPAVAAPSSTVTLGGTGLDQGGMAASPGAVIGAHMPAGGAPSDGGGFNAKSLLPFAAPLLSVAGVGTALAKGNQPLPFQQQQTATADALAAQGAQLTSAETTGQLPPGAANAITLGTEAAKARVRSQYASMGLSGSTMEGQALEQIDMHASELVNAEIDKLLTAGMSETTLANTIYQQLSKGILEQDSALQGAISNFATTLGQAGIASAVAGKNG